MTRAYSVGTTGHIWFDRKLLQAGGSGSFLCSRALSKSASLAFSLCLSGPLGLLFLVSLPVSGSCLGLHDEEPARRASLSLVRPMG